MLIGVLAALAAATLYATGIALQSLDARHSHEDDTLRPSLLLGLVRRPRWLLGGIISFLGWPLQGYALAQAPLAVVQPALAFNLVVLLVIARRFTPDPVTRNDVLGALAISAGVVALALAAPSRGGEDGRRSLLLVVILGVISALPLLLRGPMLRAAMLLPAAAGVAFTLLAIATRLAGDALTGHRLFAAACWLAVAGFAGYTATVCEMSAMRSRAATFVLPLTISVESVLPIVVGPLALSERLPASTGTRLVLAGGLLLVVAGVALLGRTPALADLRHEPGVTGG